MGDLKFLPTSGKGNELNRGGGGGLKFSRVSFGGQGTKFFKVCFLIFSVANIFFRVVSWHPKSIDLESEQ